MATLNPNLRPFWQKNGRLVKADIRVLYGGRASSKSWEFAGRVAQIGQEYTTKVLCVRRFQNKIKDSVYSLIKNQIDNFGFDGYEVQKTCILHENGSEFVFYGIERNIDEIKSFEGADILWIEEAHNLTKEQWEILEPTIRKAGSEIWISFNPRLITDFVWQNFIVNTPKNAIVRRINFDENPFISAKMLRTIEELKTRDPEAFKHIYLGEPISDDDAVVIRRSWVDAAIDFHIKFADEIGKMDGKKVVGYDVADSGDDKNATVSFDGSIAISCDEWQAGENELNASATRAKNTATKLGAMLIYDSIGVGAHTGSTLMAQHFTRFSGFNAGGKVHRPNDKYNGVKQGEYFSNIKAQAWWLVADRFRNTYDYVVNGNRNYKSHELISISSKMPGLESLKSELCTPRRDFDQQGRVKVESKKDLAARGIKSPNKADAFIMSANPGLAPMVIAGEVEMSGF